MATPYIGRFAPSPSGPLHLGSLFIAVASFIHAKSRGGDWLVRIEDLDTPRSVKGADQAILQCLEAHGLYWDEEPWYQSQRTHIYDDIMRSLVAHQQAYGCECTRRVIQANGGVYQGTCRSKQLATERHAVRLRVCKSHDRFNDLFCGWVNVTDLHAKEDCTLRRSDGIFAYNFAVVVDDVLQGITHVVRGADLIDATITQLNVFDAIAPLVQGVSAPEYGHMPLISHAPGVKLSKQNKAPAIDSRHAKTNLLRVLSLLDLNPPPTLKEFTCEQMLQWAITEWHPENLSARREIVVSLTDSPYDTGRV